MTFPTNVSVSCDPNPASDGVLFYNFYLDGVKVGSAPDPILIVSVPAAGAHTFGVSAENEWAESDQAVVSANITPAGKPTNVKVVKAA